MKTKTKVLSLMLAAVLLVTATIFGTMAYLTSTVTVENTFTVGNVEITLDEASVGTDGNYLTDKNNRRTANTYHLLPGHTYTKDPIVHVSAGKEDCYLFVKVDNEILAIEANDDDYTTIADQIVANGWTPVTGTTNIYVYGTNETPTVNVAETNVPVFGEFKIGSAVTNLNLSSYSDAKITVTAYAVQKDGFTDMTAAEIWNKAFADTTGITATATTETPEVP